MSLAAILALVAELTDRPPPRIKLPHGLVIPIAGVAEVWARVTGREPFATREAVKLARKTMFFTSERAMQELGYRPRPARDAIEDAIAWFREHRYVR
jgi:dihydroflavonol-4-reductase